MGTCGIFRNDLRSKPDVRPRRAPALGEAAAIETIFKARSSHMESQLRSMLLFGTCFPVQSLRAAGALRQPWRSRRAGKTCPRSRGWPKTPCLTPVRLTGRQLAMRQYAGLQWRAFLRTRKAAPGRGRGARKRGCPRQATGSGPEVTVSAAISGAHPVALGPPGTIVAPE